MSGTELLNLLAFCFWCFVVFGAARGLYFMDKYLKRAATTGWDFYSDKWGAKYFDQETISNILAVMYWPFLFVSIARGNFAIEYVVLPSLSYVIESLGMTARDIVKSGAFKDFSSSHNRQKHNRDHQKATDNDPNFNFNSSRFGGKSEKGASPKPPPAPRGYNDRHPDDAKLWEMIDNPAASDCDVKNAFDIILNNRSKRRIKKTSAGGRRMWN